MSDNEKSPLTPGPEVRRYQCNYELKSSFSGPIRDHFFLLRALIPGNASQKVRSQNLQIMPSCTVFQGTDSLGNLVQTSQLMAPHESFEVVTDALVECTEYCEAEAQPHPMYECSSPLTGPGPQLRELQEKAQKMLEQEGIADELEKARFLNTLVHQSMEYVPSSTCVNTTAEESLEKGCGVCQDYSHILIALCKGLKLKARYSAGLILGTGPTHAWAEIYCNGAWHGFDPTHDRQIGFGYIKLAHGRDSLDCPLNRGIYTGLYTEERSITAQVWQL